MGSVAQATEIDSTTGAPTNIETACANLLWMEPAAPSGANYSIAEYNLTEIYQLAQEHPDLLVNAAQRYARVILSQKWEDGRPWKEILEPTYRARKVKIWRAFSGLKEINNRMIEGQYDVVDEVVQTILSLAAGGKASQMKMIKGGPGTGKTELLYILDLLDAHLARTRPEFYKIAFRWKAKIQEVPELRNALIIQRSADGDALKDRVTIVNPGLENAPVLGLFPERMRRLLVPAGEKQIKAEIDVRPRPKGELDPINQQIRDAVIMHEMRKRGIKDASAMTQQQYLEILNDYITLYRYVPTIDKDSRIVRFVGETPNMGALFLEENLITSQFFPNQGLAVKLGKIPRASGGGLLVDEAKRNPEEFQNAMLDVIQNGVVSYGGMAFYGDWLILGATNIESIEKATKNSITGANASNDRADSVSMLQPIHPLQAAKIAVLLLGIENFWLRDLTSSDAQWVRADINEMFTLPDEKGRILGPEGRFAIKYSSEGPDSPSAVFVAPRALTYMGLIATATRIVTDPKRLEKFKSELSKASLDEHYVLDAEKRMQVILGDLSVDGPVAKELDRIHDLFQEGTEGITARDTEKWLKSAMVMAAQRFETEPTLTPNIVLRSLNLALDRTKIEPTGSQTKQEWVMIARNMTHTFLKSWLAHDLRMIQSGDPTRVEKLYEDVAQDIQSLSSYMFDHEGETPQGDAIKIDWERYYKIREIYKRQNFGRELIPGAIANDHFRAKQNKQMWEPLRRAVEQFVIEVEFQMNSTAQLEDYFSGRENLSPQTLEMGQRAEVIMSKFGYNRPAIRDALALLKEITRSETSRKPRPAK
jgi:hypothetical protein